MSVLGGYCGSTPCRLMSAPGYGEDMAAVFSSNGGLARLHWRGSQFIPCLSLQYFFWRESTKRRLFDPTCVSLRDPLPEKSVARLHSHTPCPLCLDWFSVRILEGITAICRLLRNKGGSSLSSLQYFRGITWPDKHALAPLCPCSLFCSDPSTHPKLPTLLSSWPHFSLPPLLSSLNRFHSLLISFYKLLTTERKLWVIASQKTFGRVLPGILQAWKWELVNCRLAWSHNFHLRIITPSCARVLWEQGIVSWESGMPVWSWTSCSLSAGAELMEREQDAQPLIHRERWTDH